MQAKQSKMPRVTRIKQVFIIMLAVIAGIAVAISAFIAYLNYEMDYAVHTIDTSVSSNGRYTLELQSVGQPLFFSGADARLVLKLNQNEIAHVDTTINDDGAQVHKESWHVQWDNSSVTARLMGSEQYDELVTIGFDGSISTEQTTEQYGKLQKTQTSTEEDTKPATTAITVYATNLTAQPTVLWEQFA